jgi:hypothetical protein
MSLENLTLGLDPPLTANPDGQPLTANPDGQPLTANR